MFALRAEVALGGFFPSTLMCRDMSDVLTLEAMEQIAIAHYTAL